MRRSSAFLLFPLCALLLAVVSAAGAGPDRPEGGGETAPAAGVALGEAAAGEETAERTAAALDRALKFLARMKPNPHLMMFLDVFHRRFGQERFRDARARYDDLMARTHPDDLPYLKALRRVLGPYDAGGADGSGPCVPSVDVYTCPAIHCDRVPPPPGYAEKLRAAVAKGGYAVAHVGLAMMAARDLGCGDLVPADLEAAAIEGMAGLVAVDGRVTDLEVEAATHLSYLGHGERLPPGFVEEVLALQRPSGGWALDSSARGRAAWHPTCYAAWYLMEASRGHEARAPMIASE